MDQKSREPYVNSTNNSPQELQIDIVNKHARHDSLKVRDENGIPSVEPVAESISLAQLRTASKPQSNYSEFNLDAMRVKPTRGPPNAMNHHLKNLYTSQMLCDLTIVVDDQKCNIHKIALTSHSEKYLTLFVDPAQAASHVEICIEGVPYDTVKQVVEYLYTLHIDIHEENIDAILNICNQLDLKALKDKCIVYLSGFNKTNVLQFLRICRRHELKHLMNQMQTFAAQKINAMYHNPHFLLLDVEDVYAILCSVTTHQRIKSEHCLLKLGVKWLKMGGETIHQDRHSFAARILECVALDQISAEVIAQQVDAIPHILEIKDCVTMLRKAFRHHAITSGSCCQSFLRHSLIAGGYTRAYPLLEDTRQTAILIIGGVGCTQDPFETGERFLKYSFGLTSKWTFMPSLPQRRYGHEMAFIDGQLYVLGGFVHAPPKVVPKPTNSVIYYEERFAKWYEASPMLMKRAHFASVYMETGHIYAFGGETDCLEPTDVCEVYSVKSDQWSRIRTLSVGRVGLCACLHNGLIYVVGGLANEMVLDLVECYNIEENSWSSKSPLPCGLCHGRLVAVEDLMFYLGGTYLSSTQNGTCSITDTRPGLISSESVFEYDDLHDSWKIVACLPTPCHFISTAVLGSRIYILGGFSSETWEYFTGPVCFNCKSCQLDTDALPVLPFGIAKAAALGITLTND